MDWSLFNRPAPRYDADNLTVWHKTVDFLTDPKFRSAYHRRHELRTQNLPREAWLDTDIPSSGACMSSFGPPGTRRDCLETLSSAA